ncbi:MAG: zinc ribbon domain-containing protein [Lachnospiraceae bacterium]|nr:zinc ribbon domain-containing protein [Candidatus Colinaster equi]
MKCSNCGAEISGKTAYCEFCGSQVTVEMKKEQETLNKAGCPNCGSSNITFNREDQGERRDKKGKEIVRATVGFCKDCGHTWTTSETKKKRKTWLWVLGWIFIFPIPLTILLLRPTCNLDKKIRYGIIAAAWIVYLIFYFNRGNSNSSKKYESKPVATVETQPETMVNSLADVSNETVEETQETTLYSIEIAANVNEEDGTVLFEITSDAPEDTRFNVTLTNANGYNETDTATILASGKGFTAEFSDDGNGLNGDYTVSISDDSDDVIATKDFTFEYGNTDGSSQEDKSDASGVDPELKSFLDAYEKFMDEYCEFMENYDVNDLSMLVEYAEVMEKYADFAEKADAYDSEKMSDADSLYYLEVMNRVNLKLAKVAYEQ